MGVAHQARVHPLLDVAVVTTKKNSPDILMVVFTLSPDDSLDHATQAAVAPPPAPPPPLADRGFEELLGTQWVIWIGGLALALGGFFLVRYSIEAGLIGPGVRITLGGIFAAALLAARVDAA